MLRISKLADYGIIVMAFLAKANAHQSSNDIANGTGLSRFTVQKVSKKLQREGLLESQRGAEGGYKLATHAASITLCDIISAIDGKVSLTECSAPFHNCALSQKCHVKPHWVMINKAVTQTLSKITLATLQENIHVS